MTPKKKKTLYEIPRWPRCHYHVHSLRKALHRILLLYFGPHTSPSPSPSPRTHGRCVFVDRRNVMHAFIPKEDLFIPSVSRTSYTPSVIPNTKKKEKRKKGDVSCFMLVKACSVRTSLIFQPTPSGL